MNNKILSLFFHWLLYMLHSKRFQYWLARAENIKNSAKYLENDLSIIYEQRKVKKSNFKSLLERWLNQFFWKEYLVLYYYDLYNVNMNTLDYLLAYNAWFWSIFINICTYTRCTRFLNKFWKWCVMGSWDVWGSRFILMRNSFLKKYGFVKEGLAEKHLSLHINGKKFLLLALRNIFKHYLILLRIWYSWVF